MRGALFVLAPRGDVDGTEHLPDGGRDRVDVTDFQAERFRQVEFAGEDVQHVLEKRVDGRHVEP